MATEWKKNKHIDINGGIHDVLFGYTEDGHHRFTIMDYNWPDTEDIGTYVFDFGEKPDEVPAEPPTPVEPEKVKNPKGIKGEKASDEKDLELGKAKADEILQNKKGKGKGK